MISVLKRHWPNYLIEAVALGAFMIAASAFTVLLEHPSSALHQALPDPFIRRSLMGLAMGLTAVTIIYSPWGRRSGAHINPSLTLAFLSLGRVQRSDAVFYLASQFIGAAGGVAIAWVLLGDRLSHASVFFAATVPGSHGQAVAFFAELAISALLFLVVLTVSSSRWGRLTGVCAGILVALYIAFEAPLSGMSMNPARSLAPAIFAGHSQGLWIYLVAPPLGMLIAAAVFARWGRRGGCAKLDHDPKVPCIFCRLGEVPTQPRQRVVIVGGGFAGVFVARALEKELHRRNDLELALINSNNYFVFQPMLPEVISGTIGMLDVVSPIRHLLTKTALHVRDVEGIDFSQRTVTTSPGFHPRPHVIPFDHLVLAPGTVTDFRGMRGLPEHALPFKNLEDALNLRNHLIRALEEAAIEEHEDRLRRQLLTFVVAGGGFSGVEVVAELNDFVREVAKNYPSLKPSELRVVLIHAQHRILPEVSEQLGRFAQRMLEKRGVELLLNAKLAAATGEEAVLADGRRIPTRTLVSTVPASPHPLVDRLELPKSKGRIQVTRELQVDGMTNVWALGDCALVPADDGGFAPPTAQHALRQATVLAKNILATIDGEPRRTFDFKGLGKMGSLGRHCAVAEILGFRISGVLAWFLWRTIYLMKLPGWGRRLKVASAWTLELLLPPELVLLRWGRQPGMVREHFEPGQEVFSQGDLGDRMYCILSGQAEVVVSSEKGEKVVGKLGPGDFFGEMALLDSVRRTATIRCTAAMNTFSLPKHEFDTLAAALPEFRQAFERVQAERLQRAS